ncbi:MAG TPA: ABC transporter permease [Vicinamibacterales bacterium]|nr:ABC transporter permease [Vicinamibacterales bacterium]
MDPSRWLARALLLLYPADVRRRTGKDLEAAFLYCVARERERYGRPGVPYAWSHLVVDGLAASVQMRCDARRARRIARQHTFITTPQEGPMSRLSQDIRYAARTMRRAPLFSTIVVLTLGLAIGATTAVFTIVNAVLLRSLPYREPGGLVLFNERIGTMAPGGFSPPDYVAFRDRVTSLESIAAYRNREYELSGVQAPERIIALRASASLLDLLGVNPVIGRTFTPAEDEASARVAILSSRLWARAFGKDPNVIGRAVMLDRHPYSVIGVMPDTFVFPSRGPLLNNVPADVFIPISFTPAERRGFGSNYNNSVIGRLKPGITAERAAAEARDLVRANAVELYPAELGGLGSVISASGAPLRDEVVGRARTLLLVVFAAVALVLLIACADIASLMLTRALSRQREMAVRAALGAGRGRVVGQLLVESGVLALAGGALGLGLAQALARVLVSMAPPSIPRLGDIAIDVRILAFSAAVSLLTALLCGLLPAVELSRPAAADALKEGGRTSSPGRRQRRMFGTLVATQVAVAVVLLVGGALLFRSFSRLMAVDPGFRGERTLTLTTSLPAAGYQTGADVRAFYTRLMERLAGIPAVAAAGASTELPLGVRERRAFAIENEREATRDLPHGVANEFVLGRYFDALGIPLRRGRFFTPQDDGGAEPVAVVNETMARRFWGGDDPLGQRVAWGNNTQHGRWMRIIGVVGDVKQGPLDSEIVPQIYTAWLQAGDRMLGDNVAGVFRSLRLVVKTQLEPSVMAKTIQQEVRAIDPALPVTAVQTMTDVVRTSAATPRFNTLLVGAFALLALLLAGIGIAGVLATSVSRRTQELGVRLALGARPRTLLAMILREGLALAAIGLAIGWPIAWMLSRVMGSLLFEVHPRDPLAFAGAAALMGIVAIAASGIPAWRATRVEPIAALRGD